MNKETKTTIEKTAERVFEAAHDLEHFNRKFDRFSKDIMKRLDMIEHYVSVENRLTTKKLDELITLIKGEDYDFKNWLNNNNIKVDYDSLTYTLLKKAYEDK